MSDIQHKCSLCEEMFTGYGHNPQPLIDDINARCCDDCNANLVIVARLGNYFMNRGESNER